MKSFLFIPVCAFLNWLWLQHGWDDKLYCFKPLQESGNYWVLRDRNEQTWQTWRERGEGKETHQVNESRWASSKVIIMWLQRESNRRFKLPSMFSFRLCSTACNYHTHTFYKENSSAGCLRSTLRSSVVCFILKPVHRTDWMWLTKSITICVLQ